MPSHYLNQCWYIDHKAGFILHARVCARIRAHTPTVGAAVYTSVAGCAQRIRAHTPTVAVKVQTCWTFKASADQRRYSSQSRKRSKVTEGQRVVLHRDVCGRIPTHTLACLYFYPRRNLRYAVPTRRQSQAWTSAPAAGAYARIEYKPGLRLSIWLNWYQSTSIFCQENVYEKCFLQNGGHFIQPSFYQNNIVFIWKCLFII